MSFHISPWPVESNTLFGDGAVTGFQSGPHQVASGPDPGLNSMKEKTKDAAGGRIPPPCNNVVWVGVSRETRTGNAQGR